MLGWFVENKNVDVWLIGNITVVKHLRPCFKRMLYCCVQSVKYEPWLQISVWGDTTFFPHVVRSREKIEV